MANAAVARRRGNTLNVFACGSCRTQSVVRQSRRTQCERGNLAETPCSELAGPPDRDQAFFFFGFVAASSASWFVSR